MNRRIGFVPVPDRPAPTYPGYHELRADAERSAAADRGFVDPVKLYRVRELTRSWEWRVRVLGHDGGRTVVEMHMLLLADERNLDPPLPPWLAEARAAAAQQDAARAAARREQLEHDEAAWAKILAGCPVEVSVLRNGTARVRNGYLHHLGHVVPKSDVVSGSERRPRRHLAGRALCETEQRAKPLDLSGGEEGPATCVRCLQYTPLVRPVEQAA